MNKFNLQVLNKHALAELKLYTNEMDVTKKCAVLVLGETEIAHGTGLTFEAALAECDNETGFWLIRNR
jgi:hypothetical protein